MIIIKFFLDHKFSYESKIKSKYQLVVVAGWMGGVCPPLT
jgi:hypothetical protein